MPLPANPHRIIPQLRAEGLLYHQNRLKRLDIHVGEQPLKPPSHSLSCHPKGLVDLPAVRALEHHVAGPVRLQLDREVLRPDQRPQGLQERLVLLG